MHGRKGLGIVRRVGPLVVALLVVFGSACSTAPTASPSAKAGEAKRVVVGSVLPLTGPISVVGLSWTRGYEMFFEKVNEQGGLQVGNDKYLFTYKSEDAHGDAEAAATGANKLVNQDGAKFVFGEILDPATAAIYQTARPKGALHLISWILFLGSPADIGKDKPLLVRPGISPHDAQIPLLNYLKKAYPNAKTIGIVAADMGYEGMIAALTTAAKERGMEVSFTEKWPFGVTDFVPVMTKVVPRKPDIMWLMLTGQGQDQGKAARDLGYKGVIVSDSPLGGEVYVGGMGAGATDLVVSGMDMSNPTEPMKEVIDRWAKKYKDTFVTDAFNAWDGGWILTQAMKKAQSVEPEKVLAALDSMTNVGDLETLFGKAKMGRAKEFGVNRALMRPIAVNHIMNQKQQLIGFFLPE